PPPRLQRLGETLFESAPPAARTVEPGPFMARTPARPVGANFGSRLRAASIASGLADELDVAEIRGRRALVQPPEAEALVERQGGSVARARADPHPAPAGLRQRVLDERR